MFTVSNSPMDTTFVSIDDALAELTELSDKFEYMRTMYLQSYNALQDVNTNLKEFVKDCHGATDATALIEELCDRFNIDASRRITATVSVTYNIVADVPYTFTVDEFEMSVADLDYRVDTYHSGDYDVIDTSVEDVSVDFVDED